MRRSTGGWWSAAAVCCLAATAFSVLPTAPAARPRPPDPLVFPARAFTADSWWNTPVPGDAPTHPQAEAVLEHLRTGRQSGDGCISLAGAENSWGQPVYWAGPGDPEHDLRLPRPDGPPELRSVRIPEGAQPADTSDAAMTVFDLERGYVVALTGARWSDARSSWQARGATVTYLASNGLDARAAGADEPRNRGTHRGNNGATMMVRYSEVLSGTIGHVLKVASGPELSTRGVWPMVGSDGDSRDPLAPPQGLRLRLKPSVDLDDYDLHHEARVIAESLQTHGLYLGDSSGTTALKLEDTAREGQGQRWTVPADGLCALPLGPELWDVLPEGYDPP